MGFTALHLAVALAGSLAAPLDVSFAPGGTGLLDVTIANKTDDAVLFNLGYVAANGAFLVPSNLQLTVTQDGKTRVLDYVGGDPRFGGRFDDYIVPLPARGSYQFAVRVADFFDLATGAPVLKPGTYSGTLALVSREPSFINLDMEGVRHLKLWKGTASSGRVALEHK